MHLLFSIYFLLWLSFLFTFYLLFYLPILNHFLVRLRNFNSMSSRTSLVFIPGAWHKPSCYDKLKEQLQTQHHLRCIPVTLPTTMDNPMATFKDDVDAARSAIKNETERGCDVIVVAHSYGGTVGNSAVKGFNRPAFTPAGTSSAERGYVIGLILIATGFCFTGLTFMDHFLNVTPPFFRVNNETGFADLTVHPQKFFYHDLPPAEADQATSMLTTQSLKALFEGREYSYSGWLDVPVWFIGTAEDQGLPIAVQRAQIGMARTLGGNVVYTELQSSHSPFLSQPTQVVQIMLQAFQSFSRTKPDEAPETLELANKQYIPLVSPWQPATWFRYGLPLVIGHFVGWTILSYRKIKSFWGFQSRDTKVD